MTKDQMQQIINQQKEQIKELSDRIRVLEADNDERVKTNQVYRALQRENTELRSDKDFYKKLADAATSEKRIMQQRVGTKVDDQIRQIVADNQQLVAQHDGSYWIGITRSGDARYLKQLEKENDELRKKNAELDGKVDLLQKRMNHLQNMHNELLYELHPEDMPEPEEEPEVKRPVMGRPKTGSIGENIEARRLRKEGYSIREIAERMGWSVGLTQQKVKSVVVDPEKVKEHRKQNRKPKKKNK